MPRCLLPPALRFPPHIPQNLCRPLHLSQEVSGQIFLQGGGIFSLAKNYPFSPNVRHVQGTVGWRLVHGCRGKRKKPGSHLASHSPCPPPYLMTWMGQFTLAETQICKWQMSRPSSSPPLLQNRVSSLREGRKPWAREPLMRLPEFPQGRAWPWPSV